MLLPLLVLLKRQHNGQICAISVSHQTSCQLTQRFVLHCSVRKPVAPIHKINVALFTLLRCIQCIIFSVVLLFPYFPLIWCLGYIMPIPAPLLDESKYRTYYNPKQLQHLDLMCSSNAGPTASKTRPYSCTSTSSGMFTLPPIQQSLGTKTKIL